GTVEREPCQWLGVQPASIFYLALNRRSLPAHSLPGTLLVRLGSLSKVRLLQSTRGDPERDGSWRSRVSVPRWQEDQLQMQHPARFRRREIESRTRTWIAFQRRRFASARARVLQLGCRPNAS